MKVVLQLSFSRSSNIFTSNFNEELPTTHIYIKESQCVWLPFEISEILIKYITQYNRYLNEI